MSKCKYCNRKIGVDRTMCNNCAQKIKLVRKLIETGQEIKKILRGEAK